MLGKPVGRWETPPKVSGSAIFGTDVDILGMLYGIVRHCPVFGSKLTGISGEKARSIPGMTAIIPLEDQTIVVADSTCTAL